MLNKIASTVVLGAGLLSLTNAECPNACSSHGTCSNYDMCLCYRNWMGNDCSERTCQFGLAHVDTPKGDLDSSSGKLTGPDETVVYANEVYPYGTTEQFPNMVDSAGNVQANSAHYYMECSNKGLCDRASGTCSCFPGYEGSACQRASCPGDCSGHGTCNSIKEIAKSDNGNIYELWDEDVTLGCVCDPGYYGADCSSRRCKYGADPLYLDDGKASPRVANWTLGFLADSAVTTFGEFAIVFYDVFGEDWRTDPIAHDADCDAVIAALEALPNDVIAGNSVQCLDQLTDGTPDHFSTLGTDNSHFKKLMTLVFSSNYGVLKQPVIDTYLDGDRASIWTDEGSEVGEAVESSLKPFVFADGFHGEFDDYVSDLCDGVLVTLKRGTDMNSEAWQLEGLDATETKLLKRCLGDADGRTGLDADFQSNEVYNWDWGSAEHPHLIKLVQKRDQDTYTRICNATTTYNAAMDSDDWCDNYSPAGFYSPLVYYADELSTERRLDLDDAANYVSDGRFYLFSLDGANQEEISTDTEYHVFTTTGMLLRIGLDSSFSTDNDAVFGNSVNYVKNYGTGRSVMDCETSTDDVDPMSGERICLDKGDRVMFFYMGGKVDDSPNNGQTHKFEQGQNTKHHNIYTIEKISRGRVNIENSWEARTEIVLDMGINFAHLNNASAYKFFPPASGGASWAKECSDRGLCNTATGLCECFTGYTSDDCSKQNTLAL